MQVCVRECVSVSVRACAHTHRSGVQWPSVCGRLVGVSLRPGSDPRASPGYASLLTTSIHSTHGSGTQGA